MVLQKIKNKIQFISKVFKNNKDLIYLIEYYTNYYDFLFKYLKFNT